MFQNIFGNFPVWTIQKLQTNKRLYFLLFSPLLSITAKYRVFAAKVTQNKVFLLYFSRITKLNTFPLFHYVFSPAFYDTCVCISMILCRLKKEHRNTFICVSVAKVRKSLFVSNVFLFFLCFSLSLFAFFVIFFKNTPYFAMWTLQKTRFLDYLPNLQQTPHKQTHDFYL